MDRDQQILELRATLDAVRPLAGASLEAADQYYEVFITFTSNALEGSTLTHGETGVLIDKGVTVGGKPLKDHIAALDHFEAMKWIRSIARSDVALSEAVMCQLHRVVVDRDRTVSGGRYASSARMALGTGVIYPNPAKIPALMKAFGAALEKSEASIESALDAHVQLASIHPFSDGNGRTARLLMNLVLLRTGIPPVSIGPEHRSGYIEVLAVAQKTGEVGPYSQFMRERLLETLINYVAVVSQGTPFDPGQLT